jgi:hypothetical protein
VRDVRADGQRGGGVERARGPHAQERDDVVVDGKPHEARVPDAPGQVGEVHDHEHGEHPTRPDHGARDRAIGQAARPAVGRGPRGALAGREPGADGHVREEGRGQQRAHRPEQRRRLPQGAGVAVEPRAAREDLQVREHVHDHEADQHDAARGHDRLHADARSRRRPRRRWPPVHAFALLPIRNTGWRRPEQL